MLRDLIGGVIVASRTLAIASDQTSSAEMIAEGVGHQRVPNFGPAVAR